MKRLGLRIITTCLLIGLAGCTSSFKSDPPASGRATVKPVDFTQPTAPQAAEKTAPAGDRTNQALQAVAARGERVVAAGFEESDNLSRALFLSSDDAGRTWTRGQLDKESVARSHPFEGVTDMAAGPAGFVAIGDGPSTVLWHSPDGTTWKHLADDPKVVRTTDYLRAVTATSTGFAIVGGSTVGGNHLVYWQSTDGVTWHRTEGPSIGLKQTVPGEVTGDEIVASGKTVVIAGNLSTPDDAHQTDRLQYWYSTDNGQHFRTAAVRGEVAKDYSVYNNALAVGDGKFVALVQGGGFDEVNNSWDTLVVEGGPTGASWQVAATPWTLGSAYEDIPGTLVKAGKDWVATAQVSTTTIDTTVAVGPTWAQLADGTDTNSQRARGTQLVTDSVAVGSDAIMVGSNDRSGSTEPAIWRYAEARVTPVALAPELSGGRPSSHVGTVLRAGKALVAVGDVSNDPTGWTRTGSDWQATTLPGRKVGVRNFVQNAVATTDGRVAAVGEKNLAIGRRAAVWVRGTDGRWTEADSPVFGVGARSPYGGPSAAAIAVGPSGWVVVGGRQDGNGHTDAWSAYSKDGRSWVEGVGGKVLPATSGDQQTRRTRSQNLRSLGSGEAGMSTVLAVGSRFVAGGDRGDGTPAVWLSANGTDWTTVVDLPLAKRVSSASVRGLERIGNTVVAFGEYDRTDDDTEGGWVTWTSKDGGLTWTNQIAAPSRAFAGELVPVPNGLIALGTTGTDDEVDAAAWFSRDGRGWKAIAVPGDRAKGPGRQGLVSGIVEDGKVLVAAFDVPPTGGGYYTLEMDLPK
ncbi:WD40/YVTN/BNR-like repeat-containing protein [Kribbella sp. NPDC004875]|uniref:WD40/YVTN/BNR-like repeat-containing protein n=1 Tax=Kribbella sp. NPDC004875 TaxID=3364107 RepID=UPI003684CEBA